MSAYQSRGTLRCPTKKRTYCYAGRKEEVIAAGLALPALVPMWARDRELLWHANEVHNKRPDARVAIGVIISIDHHLAADRQSAIAAIQEYCQRIAETHSVAVDFAIHSAPKGGDPRQIHAHVLISTSTLGPEGFGNKQRYFDVAAQRRSRATNSKAETYIAQFRRWWEEICNRALEKLGSCVRVDRRKRSVRCRDAWRMWEVELAQKLEGAPRRYLEPRAFRKAAAGKNARMFHEGFAGMSAEEINEWLPPDLPNETSSHTWEEPSIDASRIVSIPAPSPQSTDDQLARQANEHDSMSALKLPDALESARSTDEALIEIVSTRAIQRPPQNVVSDLEIGIDGIGGQVMPTLPFEDAVPNATRTLCAPAPGNRERGRTLNSGRLIDTANAAKRLVEKLPASSARNEQAPTVIVPSSQRDAADLRYPSDILRKGLTSYLAKRKQTVMNGAPILAESERSRDEADRPRPPHSSEHDHQFPQPAGMEPSAAVDSNADDSAYPTPSDRDAYWR